MNKFYMRFCKALLIISGKSAIEIFHQGITAVALLLNVDEN